MYEPVDALEAPRYSGPRTFARLPALSLTEGVDVAIFGMPWDSGTSFRPGARFGPEGVRSASALLRPYNPVQDVQVFGAVSCVDHGDAPTVPGYIEDTLARIAGYVERIHRGGAIPLGIGGDHSVTLAELRAAAAVHGPLGLVHLDAHHDVWDSYFGRPLNHGTVFRRACEEGLLDPARCLQAGMRGGLYSAADYAASTAARDGDRALGGAPLALARGLRRTGARRARETGRRSSPSTSTSSTRPSVPGRGHPRPAGRARRTRWIWCEPCAGSTSAPSTSSRSPPPTTGRDRSPPSSPRPSCSRCSPSSARLRNGLTAGRVFPHPSR